MNDDEVECSLCGKPTKEWCEQMVCRDCHVTESLEDCLAGKQVAEIRQRFDARRAERTVS